jgi:hypothetical protein
MPEIIIDSAPATSRAVRGAATERMRRCRARRRAGYRCVTVEIHDTEIDGLVRHGLLRVDDRNNPDAILAAVYEHFEPLIGRPSDAEWPRSVTRNTGGRRFWRHG